MSNKKNPLSSFKMASSVENWRSDLRFLDPVYERLKYFMGVDETVATGIIVGVVVLLLTTLVLLFFSQRRGRRHAVLIVGLCEAGKSLLFSRLVHRMNISTYTSIKENTGFYRSKNGKVKLFLADLPGHDRLRTRFLDQYKASSRGIVFVLDSSTVQTLIKDAAEFLYGILSDKDISSNVLIACNKQDIPLAKSMTVIKSQLEKEMNTFRQTRSVMLDTTDGSKSNNNTFLGKHGKDFEFSHIHPLKVEFVECSASVDGGKSCELNAVENWLVKVS